MVTTMISRGNNRLNEVTTKTNYFGSLYFW